VLEETWLLSAKRSIFRKLETEGKASLPAAAGEDVDAVARRDALRRSAAAVQGGRGTGLKVSKGLNQI